ncbi:uroporphyrinogen-III synthase [Pseudomonas sp. CR3202]|uniref:uroporphyrinogen-III synthase n=1 Tax=Pseudomonas sp. CR3202 TaxID=3351532 RepID=UPI003BF18EE2
MTGWRLLLTRPVEECEALAATLAEQQVFSSSMPLLTIEPLAESPEQRGIILELDRYCAVVVVSKPAARLGLDLLDRYWPQPPAGQRWFSVGSATGALLDAYGLPTAWPASGDDSEALLSLSAFSDALAVADPKVLIMRGEGGREFLAERLRGQGVAVDYLELYRRCLPEYPADALARRVEAECLNGLVVSSGQGLENLQRLAGDAWADLAHLTLFVPSPRVAEQAIEAGAKNVVDCRGASAAALLAALRQHPAPTL